MQDQSVLCYPHFRPQSPDCCDYSMSRPGASIDGAIRANAVKRVDAIILALQERSAARFFVGAVALTVIPAWRNSGCCSDVARLERGISPGLSPTTAASPLPNDVRSQHFALPRFDPVRACQLVLWRADLVPRRRAGFPPESFSALLCSWPVHRRVSASPPSRR